MSEQKIYVYPTISANNWWKLRELLRKRTPPQINDTYIAQVMDMKATSARSNVLPALRILGLVGENDQPTALVARWREDSDYADVCREMLEATYPPELLDVFPGPEINRDKLREWFRKNAGANEATAVKMAITYTLLAQGDADQASQGDKTNVVPKKQTATKAAGQTPKSAAATSKTATSTKGEVETDEIESKAKLVKELRQPTIHVDVQIHISPETTPEQIRAIFENMAKYFNE